MSERTTIPRPVPEDTTPSSTLAQQPADGDLRRIVLVLGVLAIPFVALSAILYFWWSNNTTERFGPIAHRGGHVAFVQSVEYSFPSATDVTVWLGDTIEERDTWHQLAPTNTADVRSFTWLSGEQLRIKVATDPGADWTRQVGDISIEWVR